MNQAFHNPIPQKTEETFCLSAQSDVDAVRARFVKEFGERPDEDFRPEERHCETWDIMLAGFRAGLTALEEPVGWKLVPIEPTTVMDNAGVIAFTVEGYGATQADARACYKAMLAAAPPPLEE